MQGSHDSSVASNTFSASFLDHIASLDEPPTAGEVDVAGPWRVLELPGSGHGLFRLGESPSRGFRPVVIFEQRWLALLAAAVLPGTGQDTALRLRREPGPSGFEIESTPGGETIGTLQVFDERLVDALHVVERLVRSPVALANLMEAAGTAALERAGAILYERTESPGNLR